MKQLSPSLKTGCTKCFPVQQIPAYILKKLPSS